MVANQSKVDMQGVAAYFAEQKPQLIEFKADPARLKLGLQKAEETLCSMCHLGGLKGQNEISRLSGQHYDYTFTQLTDFKGPTWINVAENIAAVAKTRSNDDVINLSHYVANLN